MVWLFGDDNTEDFLQLPYITMCVKETLRLYPIAPYMYVAKLSSEEVMVNADRGFLRVNISGCLSTGTWLGLGIQAMHCDPSV